MRRPVTVAAAVLSAAVLSACGTGLDAQVYQPRDPADSTSASVGRLALRNLAVETVSEQEGAPAGGGALLTGLVVNAGKDDDALVNAETDVAREVQLVNAEGSGELLVPAGRTSGTAWAVQLSGLTRELGPGQYIAVTLEFARAGRTTVQVPVRTLDNGLAEREVLQNPYHGGGEGGGEAETEGKN